MTTPYGPPTAQEHLRESMQNSLNYTEREWSLLPVEPMEREKKSISLRIIITNLTNFIRSRLQCLTR